MSIVTLTTDFGLKDYYVAVIKGAMLCENPTLNLVDITHNIPSYDIVQGAFVLRHSWRSFPKGSIHLVSVNSFYSKDCSFIAFEKDGHFFIGPDNGILSLVFDELNTKIFELAFPEFDLFPLKAIFSKAVAHLSAGKTLAEIGTPKIEILRRISLQPVISPVQIRGSIIYIDKYENVVLNIHQTLFEHVAENRPFKLYFKRFDPIRKLSQHYYDVPIGEVLCLFNSASYLEIAINMGKASSLLGLKIDDTVQIDFLDL